MEEIPPISPTFRKVVRLFSLALYFAMFAAAAAGVSYGWQKSNQLEEANSELAKQRDAAITLRRQLAEESRRAEAAVFDPQIPPTAGVSTTEGALPVPPQELHFAPRVRTPIGALSDGVDSAEHARLERQLTEADRVIAAQQVRIKELETLRSQLLDTSPPADLPEEAIRKAEAQRIAGLWTTAITNPSDRKAIADLGAVLAPMKDADALAWLRARLSPEPATHKPVLDLVLVRAPIGGDELVHDVIRVASTTDSEGEIGASALAALAGYSGKTATDGRFRIASRQVFPAVVRGQALFALAIEGDSRAAPLAGELFNALAPGDPERLRLIAMAKIRRDGALLDPALSALADRRATSQELEAAAATCRALAAEASPRVRTLSLALAERGDKKHLVETARALATELEAIVAKAAGAGGE